MRLQKFLEGCHWLRRVYAVRPCISARPQRCIADAFLPKKEHPVVCSPLQFTFSGQTWVPADDGLNGASVPMPALGFGRTDHADQVGILCLRPLVPWSAGLSTLRLHQSRKPHAPCHQVLEPAAASCTKGESTSSPPCCPVVWRRQQAPLWRGRKLYTESSGCVTHGAGATHRRLLAAGCRRQRHSGRGQGRRSGRAAAAVRTLPAAWPPNGSPTSLLLP